MKHVSACRALRTFLACSECGINAWKKIVRPKPSLIVARRAQQFFKPFVAMESFFVVIVFQRKLTWNSKSVAEMGTALIEVKEAGCLPEVPPAQCHPRDRLPALLCGTHRCPGASFENHSSLHMPSSHGRGEKTGVRNRQDEACPKATRRAAGRVGSLFPDPQPRTFCCALDHVWGWISRGPLAQSTFIPHTLPYPFSSRKQPENS